MSARFRFSARGATGDSIDGQSEDAAFRFSQGGVKVAIKVSEGELGPPTWDAREVDHGAEVVLNVAVLRGLEGARVRFVVERREGETWLKHAEAEGVVKDGAAQARVRLHHPEPEAAEAADVRFYAEVV